MLTFECFRCSSEEFTVHLHLVDGSLAYLQCAECHLEHWAVMTQEGVTLEAKPEASGPFVNTMSAYA